MAERVLGLGPGTVRVGRFIGRLGVVGLPTISVGLGLAERVVRRHVARLEQAGFLQRTPAQRGDGSLCWLTPDGLAGIGLGQLAAVRAPAPVSATTRHSVRVAQAAAQLERAGVGWRAVRELALDRQRWAIAVANERGGHSRRLPDLAAWPAPTRPPVAIVIGRGGQPHPRRQRALLAGYQHAIAAGRYAAVRYQTGPAGAYELTGLAHQLGLRAPQFGVAEQITADQLVITPPAAADDTPTPAAAQSSPVYTPTLTGPASQADLTPPGPHKPAGTPEQTAERQRLIDELLGHNQPPPRRRWWRR